MSCLHRWRPSDDLPEATPERPVPLPVLPAMPPAPAEPLDPFERFLAAFKRAADGRELLLADLLDLARSDFELAQACRAIANPAPGEALPDPSRLARSLGHLRGRSAAGRLSCRKSHGRRLWRVEPVS